MSKIKGVFIKLGTKLPDGPFSFQIDPTTVKVTSLTATPMGNPAGNGCKHSFSLNFTIEHVSQGPKPDEGYEMDEIANTCAKDNLTFWAFDSGAVITLDNFGLTVAGDGSTPKSTLHFNYVLGTGKVNSSAGPHPINPHKVLKVFGDK